MRVAIGADHQGVELKRLLAGYLAQRGIDVVDVGVAGEAPADYPLVSARVAGLVRAGEVDRGVLICGSGVGVCVAANKISGIRAALCADPFVARKAVEDDDCNLLCLGCWILGEQLAAAILDSFLQARFSGLERHVRRREEVAALELATAARAAARPPHRALRLLAELGQSLWLDCPSHALLASGTLGQMIAEIGLRGLARPPAFEPADPHVAHELGERMCRTRDAQEAVDAWLLGEVGHGADLLAPAFEASQGVDGYACFDLPTWVARDARRTVAEARRRHGVLGRPNVMARVPATDQGLAALRVLIAQGVSVNITDLFSLERYERVAEAYLRGLEDRLARKQALDCVASVASFSLAPLDAFVDRLIDQRVLDPSLKGTAGVACAKLAAEHFQELFEAPRFAVLRGHGARPQRLMWAEVEPQGAREPRLKYVEPLVGAETVLALSPSLLREVKEHAHLRARLHEGLEVARRQVEALKGEGIDLGTAGAWLEQEVLERRFDHHEAMLAALRGAPGPAPKPPEPAGI